jgi:quercetin dioxygenase-like cupin family protein
VPETTEILEIVHYSIGTPAPPATRRPRSLEAATMTDLARLHRWDEIALEKITEMISRKIIPGGAMMLAHVYLKRGALVPMHHHPSEQMTYVLQGSLRCQVGSDEIIVREGDVLHIPSEVPHQAEAMDDTLELDVFAPTRSDWAGEGDGFDRTALWPGLP